MHCYAECRYAECRYAECRYAECRYAECCYAQCRDAIFQICLLFTNQGPYSQHFIFFLTYKRALSARLLHYTRLKSLSSDKHSCLF